MRFKNYRNSYNNENRIISEDDLWQMAIGEAFDREGEIMSQYRAIGIPGTEALRASSNVVWVDEYTRDDGTKVSGYWRSKPEGESDEGISTGGAAGVDNLRTQSGRIPSGQNYKTGESIYENWDKNGNIYYTNSKDEVVDISLNNGQKFQRKLYEQGLKKSYPISSGFVVDAMHDFAHAKSDKNAEVIQGMGRLKPSVRQALKEYGVPEDSSGVIYNENSSVSDSFSNSQQLKEWAQNPEIQEKIKNGTLTDEEKSFHFEDKKPFSKGNFDRHASVQHAKIVNPKISSGYMEGTLVDYYDFNQRPDTPQNYPNNWGYEMQEKGLLRNYYICIKVRVKL